MADIHHRDVTRLVDTLDLDFIIQAFRAQGLSDDAIRQAAQCEYLVRGDEWIREAKEDIHGMERRLGLPFNSLVPPDPVPPPDQKWLESAGREILEGLMRPELRLKEKAIRDAWAVPSGTFRKKKPKT